MTPIIVNPNSFQNYTIFDPDKRDKAMPLKSVTDVQNYREGMAKYAENGSVRQAQTLRIRAAKNYNAAYRVDTAIDAGNFNYQGAILRTTLKDLTEVESIKDITMSAMYHQYDILETLHAVATQAAQDKTLSTLSTLQYNLTTLLKSYDDTAQQATYEGYPLLTGTAAAKIYDIGLDTTNSLSLAIESSVGTRIGYIDIDASSIITKPTVLKDIAITYQGNTYNLPNITISNREDSSNEDRPSGSIRGYRDYRENSREIGYRDYYREDRGITGGVDVLANLINELSEREGIGITAEYEVTQTSDYIEAGNYNHIRINGVNIGHVKKVQDGDADGRLLEAINAVSNQTGVTATNVNGRLQLESADGRGMEISGIPGIEKSYYGQITLTINDPDNTSITGLEKIGIGIGDAVRKEITLDDLPATMDITSLAGAKTVSKVVKNAEENLEEKIEHNEAALNHVIDALETKVDFLLQQQSEINEARESEINPDIVKIFYSEEDTPDIIKRKLLTEAGSFYQAQANILTMENMKTLIELLL